MKNFVFNKQETKLIPISIDNCVYQARADVKTLKAVERYTKSMKPLIRRLHGNMGDADVRKLNREVARNTEICLDTILGRGTYLKIFANRSLDFTEQCNLMTFIFEQVSEALNEYPA